MRPFFRGTWRILPLLVVLCVGAAACGGSGKDKKATTTTAAQTATTLPGAVPTAVSTRFKLTDSTSQPAKVTEWAETDSITGSYRSTAQDGSADEAFDSNSRTYSKLLDADGSKSLKIETNASVGGPDSSTRTTAVLAQYVGALQDANDPYVQATTVLGRTALRAAFDVGGGSDFDRADVTVDSQTLIPLIIDTTKGGQPYMKWEVTEFNPSPNVAGVSYLIQKQDKVEVYSSDSGFTETQADLVKSQVGYQPLVPTVVPAGMAVTRVLTHAGKGEPTGVDDKNPQSQDIVVQQYMSGWRSLVFTTRAAGGDPVAWKDPFADVADQFGTAPQPFATTTGAMGIANGQTVMAPTGVPHLWVAGTSLVFTSTGPFSAATQAAAANSLQ